MSNCPKLLVGALAFAAVLQPCVVFGQTLPVIEESTAVTPATPEPFFPKFKIIPATIPEQSAAQRYRTEVVCRITIVTGSFIAKRKACLTRKQWDYVDQAHEDEARKLMMDNMGHPSG